MFHNVSHLACVATMPHVQPVLQLCPTYGLCCTFVPPMACVAAMCHIWFILKACLTPGICLFLYLWCSSVSDLSFVAAVCWSGLCWSNAPQLACFTAMSHIWLVLQLCSHMACIAARYYSACGVAAISLSWLVLQQCLTYGLFCSSISIWLVL